MIILVKLTTKKNIKYWVFSLKFVDVFFFSLHGVLKKCFEIKIVYFNS